MVRKILIIWAGILVGVLLAYLLITRTKILSIGDKNVNLNNVFSPPPKIVLGFLPFWLIDKAQTDYSPYLNQISYFNLTIDSDGTIQKYTSPGESDPGYLALTLGKVDDFLAAEKTKGVNLSLTIFSGDDEKIDSFLQDPALSAQNLISDISPIMNQYGFSDLNLDIEKVSDASPEARLKYAEFVSGVKKNLNENVSVTIDCPPISFVKDKNLCDPKSLSQIADHIVLMDYDFHNPGSFVTGPISPQSGAGIVSEFDTESAVQAALTMMSANKLILALPLYGYSWETINSSPRSAILPGSALTISTNSISDLLSSCATCSASFDATDEENHLIYKDAETGTYHQIFYPDQKSMQIKVNFAKGENLGGIGLWALGYEDNIILNPLKNYLSK